MKFCQIDKISTYNCIFDDAEIFQIGQDFKANCKQMQQQEIFLRLNSYYHPQGV